MALFTMDLKEMQERMNMVIISSNDLGFVASFSRRAEIQAGRYEVTRFGGSRAEFDLSVKRDALEVIVTFTFVRDL